MARKIFIAATGMNSGKTTTSLSLIHMAKKKYDRVAFIKPIGPKPIEYQGVVADKDAVVIARHFDMVDDLSYDVEGRFRKREGCRQKSQGALRHLDSELVDQTFYHGGGGLVVFQGVLRPYTEFIYNDGPVLERRILRTSRDVNYDPRTNPPSIDIERFAFINMVGPSTRSELQQDIREHGKFEYVRTIELEF